MRESVRGGIRTRRMLGTGLLLAALVVTVFGPGRAGATLISALELEELTWISDPIVEGEVIEISEGWDRARSKIRTRVTLNVHRVIRGSLREKSLVIELPGGSAEEGGLRQVIPGLPTFAVGEEVIVFLAKGGHLAFCPIAGWAQGKLRVITETGSGRKVVQDRFGAYRRYRERNRGISEGTSFSREGEVSLNELAGVIAEIEATGDSDSIRDLGKRIAPERAALTALEMPTSEKSLGGYAFSGYKWPDETLPVPYWVYTGTPPPAPISISTFVNAVKGGFQKWEDVPSSYMSFRYRGETAAYRPNLDVTDSRNVIGYTTEDLGTALAITAYWVSGTTMVEADIAVNRKISWSASTPTPFTSYDLHTAMLHEAGHTLSLNDLYAPAYSAEVMFGYVYDGEMKRELGSGDREGITAIYPKAGDLTILEVKGPASGLEYSQVQLSAKVKNVGGGFTASCQLEFYLSLNSTISSRDDLLGQKGIPGLAAGEEHEATVVVELPNVSLDQNYYVCALVDSAEQVAEMSEENNTDHYYPIKVWRDSDADSLPDWWEIEMGLDENDPNGAEGPTGDPDTDGLRNEEEYPIGTHPGLEDTDGDGQKDGDEVYAGTDPTDETSLFRISKVVVTGAGDQVWVAIAWRTVLNKRYQAYYQENAGGEWIPLGTIHVGTGGVLGQTDLEGLLSGSRYYRVAVE